MAFLRSVSPSKAVRERRSCGENIPTTFTAKKSSTRARPSLYIASGGTGRNVRQVTRVTRFNDRHRLQTDPGKLFLGGGWTISVSAISVLTVPSKFRQAKHTTAPLLSIMPRSPARPQSRPSRPGRPLSAASQMLPRSQRECSPSFEPLRPRCFSK